MKITLLKNIIKEAVREVIREEFNLGRNTGNFQNARSGTGGTSQVGTTLDLSNQIKTESTTLPSSKKISPLLEQMLLQTSNELTPYDVKNIMGEGTVLSENALNTLSQHPEPVAGLDLSALPFTNKASEIFKKSIQIDKNRAGM